MSIRWAIALVAIASTIGAILVGIRRYRIMGPGGRALLQWLVASLLISLMMLVLSVAGIRTNPFAQLSYPLFGLLGIRALAILHGRAIAMQLGMAAWGGYLLWWGWWLWRGEMAAAFGAYNAPALWLLLSAMGAAVVAARLRADIPRPWQDPAVRAGWGMMLSYTPGLTLDALGAMHYDGDPGLILLLFRLRSVLYIGGIALFALALQRSRT